MFDFMKGFLLQRKVNRVAAAPEGKYPPDLVQLARVLQDAQRLYRDLDEIQREGQGVQLLRLSQETAAVFLTGLAHFERTGTLPKGGRS